MQSTVVQSVSIQQSTTFLETKFFSSEFLNGKFDLLTLFFNSKVMAVLVELRESGDKSNKQKINSASYSTEENESSSD